MATNEDNGTRNVKPVDSFESFLVEIVPNQLYTNEKVMPDNTLAK